MTGKPTFRVFLDEWVKAKGLTQEAVARAAGISPNHLSQVKNGRDDKQWNAGLLVAVAEALGLDDAKDLFRHPDDRPPTEDHRWERIPTDQRPQARRAVDSVLEAFIPPPSKKAKRS